AHAVNREARDGTGQPGEQSDVAPERQPLISDLCGGREDDVVDPLGCHRRVAAQQFADELDRHVVGPRPPEHPVRPRPTEGGSDTVDEVDLANVGHHAKATVTLSAHTRRPRARRGSIRSPRGGGWLHLTNEQAPRPGTGRRTSSARKRATRTASVASPKQMTRTRASAS